MQKSLFRVEIRLGKPLFAVALFVLFLITMIAAAVMYLIFSAGLFWALAAVIPLIALSIFFAVPFRVIYLKLGKRRYSELEIFEHGIAIKKDFLQWHKIKSISFQTGRPIHDRLFFRGFKLPAYQKLFLLDREGREYSSIIDVDYWLKDNREENNLTKMNILFNEMGKVSLMSDWAEKR